MFASLVIEPFATVFDPSDPVIKITGEIPSSDFFSVHLGMLAGQSEILSRSQGERIR